MPEYRAFGLQLRSQFELPGLQGSGPLIPGQPVGIGAGPVPDPPAGAVAVGPNVHLEADSITLGVPGLARFLVRGGRDITVAAAPGAGAIDFAPVLLGPVLALLGHQRGLLPVHASGVQVQHGCVLLVGPPCSGKSTIAAALCRRGHPLVADDLCMVHVPADGSPSVFPGPASAGLWKDALHAMDVAPENLRPVRPGLEKFALPLPGATRAAPVRHMVVIHGVRGDRDDEREVGIDAVATVIEHTWMPRLLGPLGSVGRHFRMAAAVANAAAIWHWSRPEGIRRLPGAISGLEAAWRATGRSRP